MKLKELQDKIERRTSARQTLEQIEKEYDALRESAEEYGELVSVDRLIFTTPVELISIGMKFMPDIPVEPIIKAIGESIVQMKKYISDIDEELKGIVEFEEEAI